jgi:hypothetical protein
MGEEPPLMPIPCEACRSWSHAECLVPWIIAKGSSCPTCREVLVGATAAEGEDGLEAADEDGDGWGERDVGRAARWVIRILEYWETERIYTWPFSLLLIHMMLGFAMLGTLDTKAGGVIIVSPSSPSPGSSIRECIVVSNVVVDMTVLMMVAGDRAREARRGGGEWRLSLSATDLQFMAIAVCILFGTVIARDDLSSAFGAGGGGDAFTFGSASTTVGSSSSSGTAGADADDETAGAMYILGVAGILFSVCVPACLSSNETWRRIFLTCCSVFGTCTNAMKTRGDAAACFWVCLSCTSGAVLGMLMGR